MTAVFTSDKAGHIMTSTDCVPSGAPFSAFHLFLNLPASLRLQILSYAMPAPRTRFLELYAYTAPTYAPRIRYIPPLPALFSVSRETRNTSIAHEGGTLMHFFFLEKESKRFYINFERDIVFLSSRFSPRGSTESSRLRELSSLLKPGFLAQLRRIVVTFSRKDDFVRTGWVVMDFGGLETLYVAMCDKWSEDKLKARVRMGDPAEGYVAWQIEGKVNDAQGDETEDEDETPEEYKKRVQAANRARLRVIECELRLGD